jgi:hypothetical protein
MGLDIINKFGSQYINKKKKVVKEEQPMKDSKWRPPMKVLVEITKNNIYR